jgi:hypothetical protein
MGVTNWEKRQSNVFFKLFWFYTTVSLMDSNIDENDLLSNPDKLCTHLGDCIEEIGQTLDEEEDFCNKDIDSTILYIQKMERKFHEKTEKLKAELEKIRLENKATSEKNKNKHHTETEEINASFISGKHYEGLLNDFILIPIQFFSL